MFERFDSEEFLYFWEYEVYSDPIFEALLYLAGSLLPWTRDGSDHGGERTCSDSSANGKTVDSWDCLFGVD
jgi:hypothetical protein